MQRPTGGSVGRSLTLLNILKVRHLDPCVYVDIPKCRVWELMRDVQLSAVVRLRLDAREFTLVLAARDTEVAVLTRSSIGLRRIWWRKESAR